MPRRLRSNSPPAPPRRAPPRYPWRLHLRRLEIQRQHLDALIDTFGPRRRIRFSFRHHPAVSVVLPLDDCRELDDLFWGDYDYGDPDGPFYFTVLPALDDDLPPLEDNPHIHR